MFRIVIYVAFAFQTMSRIVPYVFYPLFTCIYAYVFFLMYVCILFVSLVIVVLVSYTATVFTPFVSITFASSPAGPARSGRTPQPIIDSRHAPPRLTDSVLPYKLSLWRTIHLHITPQSNTIPRKLRIEPITYWGQLSESSFAVIAARSFLAL